ncbi:MAG: 2-hydroxychromene-2-carboxylate isomerase [Emcibacter sp.]|nr:2-hydroxychromene-2-carboxylate isomerase [Emcibacter sp.]
MGTSKTEFWPKIEFWYEFASTYSYLAAERIQSLAQSNGMDIAWRPFLLGPIFKSQGWDTSPFGIYKAKGNYMWRDIERSADLYGLPFKKSDQVFPQNSILAARIALCLPDADQRGEFSKSAYRAEFSEGQNIAEPQVIAQILNNLGHDSDQLFQQAKSPDIKQALFANTAEAQEKGIFGAPSLITGDGELFWGDDRLEQALNWPKTSP